MDHFGKLLGTRWYLYLWSRQNGDKQRDGILSIPASFQIIYMDAIHKTPIWFNPNLKINFENTWFDHGLRTLSDIVHAIGRSVNLNEFQAHYDPKTNFLENVSFCLTIEKYVRYKDRSNFQSTQLRNTSSLLDIMINKDVKGVSNLYKFINKRSYHIIEEICSSLNIFWSSQRAYRRHLR